MNINKKQLLSCIVVPIIFLCLLPCIFFTNTNERRKQQLNFLTDGTQTNAQSNIFWNIQKGYYDDNSKEETIYKYQVHYYGFLQFYSLPTAGLLYCLFSSIVFWYLLRNNGPRNFELFVLLLIRFIILGVGIVLILIKTNAKYNEKKNKNFVLYDTGEDFENNVTIFEKTITEFLSFQIKLYGILYCVDLAFVLMVITVVMIVTVIKNKTIAKKKQQHVNEIELLEMNSDTSQTFNNNKMKQAYV